MKINLIQELHGGIPENPEMFYSETLAGQLFEQTVSHKDVGFRKKLERESWSEYESAFHEYEHNERLPYDTADWEIHWYRITSNDNDPIIKTTLPEVTQQFDDFEIQPCCQVDEDSIEVCEPGEEDFWGVYIHLTEGGVDCIADFLKKEQADAFVIFLNSLFKKKKESEDEGTVSWHVDDFEYRAREIELEQIEEKKPTLYNKLVHDSELPIPNKWKQYDRTKFRDALSQMIRKHDATIGITWDTIDIYLDEFCQLNVFEN